MAPPSSSNGVVNINIGGTIVAETIRGAFNAALAQQVADALDTASANGTLSYVTYTGGSPPTVASGSTQELILSPTLSGSFTIPAASAGVQQVLVIPSTASAPVTIHGYPGLTIVGASANSVTIIDPASIVLADNGATTYQDAVTVTAADANYTVGTRAGNETVVGLGSGTISGGTLKNLIDVSQSTGSNVIISEGSGGDTVFTGAGATTIEATSAAKSGAYIDGAGSFAVNDQGTADTILATAAATASVTTGGSQALVLGGADSLAVLNAGTANTVSAGKSAASVTASGGSSGLLLFGGAGTLNYVDGGQNDTVAAGAGAASILASGNAALIFGTFGSTAGSFAMSVSGTAATVSAGNSNAVVTTSGNSALVFGGFSSTAGTVTQVDAGTGTTISGGASNMAVTLSGSNALVLGGFKSQVATPGTLNVVDQGSNDTIAVGDAAASVTGGGWVFGGTSTLNFLGGGTVVAGSGAAVISAGLQAKLVVAAGAAADTVVGSGGGTTLFGAANGSIVFQSSVVTHAVVPPPGNLLYAAGSGNETLNASATEGNIVFAGADSKGADVINAGLGNNTLVGGKATTTMTGGGFDDQYFFVQSVTGGAGNINVITDFSTASDSVALFGYGQSAAAIIANASTIAGNTTLMLSDNTRITFLNVSSASAIHLTSS